MTKFVRGPLEVEAFQWKGQPQEQWPVWAQEAAEGGQHGALWRNGMHLTIDSPQGPIRVNQGDWVVKNGNRLLSVSEEDFARDYAAHAGPTTGAPTTTEPKTDDNQSGEGAKDPDSEKDEPENENNLPEGETTSSEGVSNGTETEVSQDSDAV